MARLTSLLALLCALLTLLWLGLLIFDVATAGPQETFEQVAAHRARLGAVFYATYLNATLITLTAMTFFAALYGYLQPTAPAWLVVGIVFVPVFGALNLVVYLTQVTVVPALFELRADPLHMATADLLLRLTLQTWPASAVAFFNGLAYAILSIPSILFGAQLWGRSGALRWGGLLLVLNGVACIVGIAGLLVGSALLSLGTLVGGLLFLLALALISWGLWRSSP